MERGAGRTLRSDLLGLAAWAACIVSCASPTEAPRVVAVASTSSTGPGAVAFDLRAPEHRRDWYGRGDKRPWLPLVGVEDLAIVGERRSCAVAPLEVRAREGRFVRLSPPAEEAPEIPLRLRGDCRWLVGRSPGPAAPQGPTLIFRGGPDRWLRGRTRRGVLHVGGAATPVEGVFELPAPETPELHVAILEGHGSLELVWAPPSLPAPRPVEDAIVVLIDTLRADRLAPFAPGSRVRLPHFEAFARGADVFTKAYAVASWTKPAAGSVLTALYPWQHRAIVHDAPLRADVTTLAEALRDWGIATVAFSGNGYVSERFGFHRGFDDFHSVGQLGRGRLADEVEDLLAWIDARPAPRQRYFAYLHATDPHWPYTPKPEDLRAFDRAPYDGPIDAADPLLLRRIHRGEVVLTPRDRERLLALYDAEVRGLDAAFGALVEGLRRRGRLERTLIVFVADHGEELFDHGSVGHGNGRLHQELIRVPLAVHWPGVSAGRRVQAPVSQIDVAPTVLEALGLPPELGSPSARSLRHALAEPPERFVAFGAGDQRRGITDGRLVLIRDRDGRMRLHDLEVDPAERDDRTASDPLARRYLLQALAREMAANPTHRDRRAVRLSDSLRQQLRALGYLGDE